MRVEVVHQHQLIARNNGVSEAQLKAVLDEHTVASLDPSANLVCQVADELETGATVSDETFEQLYAAFDRRSATELLFILSFYSAVARISNATRIPIEDDNPLQRTSDLTIQR